MTLAYERRGSGPPLVLIHGLGHRRQGWTAVLDQLTPHREVITFDLPGHGESPPLNLAGRSPVAAMTEETLALFAELGLDRPHVGGNSLGGAISLVLAARGRAASATALSPAGFWRVSREVNTTRMIFTASWLAARAILPAVSAMSRSTAGRAVLYGPMVTHPSRITPEQADGDVHGFVAARGPMIAVFRDFEPFNESIRADVPVTIAWGDKDRVLRPSGANIARQRIPQAKLVRLPGCGHVPMTDDPRLVAKVLLDGSAASEGSAAREGARENSAAGEGGAPRNERNEQARSKG